MGTESKLSSRARVEGLNWLSTVLCFFLAYVASNWGWNVIALCFTSLAALITLFSFYSARSHTDKKKLRTLVAGAFAVISIITVVQAISILRKEGPYSGVIVPSADPLPAEYANYLSNIPPTAASVILGSVRGHVYNPGDKLSLIKYEDQDLLHLSVDESGAYLSGQFFDKEGKVVAIIDRNRFQINELNFLRPIYRPDRSTLIVRDQANVEVLNLKHWRSNVFSLTGVIRLPNRTELTISSEKIIDSANSNSLGDQFFLSSGGVLISINKRNDIVIGR